MPDTPSQPLVPVPKTQSPQSPGAIAELRRYIAALQQKPPYKGMFYTWANGLDDATRPILGAMLSNRADEQERQGREAGASEWTKAMSPYLTPTQPASSNGAPSPRPRAPSPFTPPTTQADGTGAGTPDDLTAFIKDREGFRSAPYVDGKQTSIGYGTRAQPGEKSISRDEADSRLNTEFGNAARAVDDFAPNLPPQIKSALTDLTYNTGTKWQNSGLGQAVKAGDWQTAQ